MTLEAAALSALSAVTAALCFLFSLLWSRSQKCEEWRAEKEPVIREMSEKLGALNAFFQLVQKCRIQGCPFTEKVGETFSITHQKK